jgi:hypothetical protein
MVPETALFERGFWLQEASRKASARNPARMTDFISTWKRS